MAYADYEHYRELYDDDLSEIDFNRLSWEAGRRLDYWTTGIDNVRKLRAAFPTDPDDAEAVRRCACALVNIYWQLEQLEQGAADAAGYTHTENGLLGKVISSISSGNESISYATSVVSTGRIAAAASDPSERERLVIDTIQSYLRGVTDANGVNLMWMGGYPYKVER